jgi:tetratricopeptide (TPR) repeat protein
MRMLLKKENRGLHKRLDKPIDNIRLNAYQVLNYVYDNNFEEPTKTAKIKQLLNVIDKNVIKTGDKNLLFLGANYNFEAGNFSKALEYLNRLIALDSKNSDYFLLRTRIYFQMQNYDSSKKDVELVLENDINNLEAHCPSVQIAYTTNNITEQTLRSIEIVIENSEKVDNYFNFIAFKTKADNENNIQQSIDYYTKALLFAEEQNDIIELYSKRADAYLKLDNLDLAENDILHALDINESDVNLLQKLLMIYAKQNRVDDASKIIEKIKSIKEKQG